MSIKFDITGDGEFAEAMEKAMKPRARSLITARRSSCS